MLHAVRVLLRRMTGDLAPRPPLVANHPSSTKTPAENFKTMRLLYRHHAVDELGRWHRIETRQCPYTGVIFRHTKRITD